MTISPRLDPAAITAALATLPGWTLVDGQLRRHYPTRDWRETMMRAGGIAWAADRADHHPDLHLAYRGLTVTLSTHDAGGITAKDFALARQIEELNA